MSLIERAKKQQWDGTFLTGLSPTAIELIETKQSSGEPKFGVILQTLGGNWGQFYNAPASLDSRISQRREEPNSRALCGWTHEKVMGWLHDCDLNSLERLASRDHWTGMTLANLDVAEMKQIERSQPNDEPWFGDQLEFLQKQFPDVDDPSSNFSFYDIPDGFISHGGSSASFHERRGASRPTCERSQWDFEDGLGWDDEALCEAFHVPWNAWPFWRVGIELRRIIVSSRLPLSVIARLSFHYGECDQRERVDRDLLPLPLIELSAEDEVDSIVQEWEDVPGDELPGEELIYKCQRVGEESWVFAMMCVLNFMNTGRDLKQHHLATMRGPPTDAQREAIVRLYDNYAIFKDFDAQHNLESLVDTAEQILEKVELNYSGEEVHPARVMTWSQLKPAMPEKGQCGKVRMSDLCDGVLSDVIRQPELLLRPEDEWPSPTEMKGRDKRNWCSDDDWLEIVRGCADIELFDFLKPDQLLRLGGEPVLHNCLGVGKGKFLDDGREILRMVMNLDVTNQILRVLLADIRSLPYPGQWNAVSIENEELIIFHSGTDLTCAYFAFKMEQVWWKYMAFNGAIKGSDIADLRPDLSDEQELYACCTCLAMGFNSASGLMQLAHNVMAQSPKPSGCGLPIRQQMRTDYPAVKLEPGLSAVLWETFQDNFEASEIGSITDALKLMSTECPVVCDMIDTYAVWGAAEAKKKTFHRKLVCESLGYIKDGIIAAHYGTNNAIMLLIFLTAYMCSLRSVQVRFLQIVSGRWSRQIQVRRELAQLLDETWRALARAYKISSAGSEFITVTTALRGEWLCLLASLPLLVMDYRKRTDSVVTASDASEEGCGVCRSKHVTSQGVKFYKQIGDMPDFASGEDIMLVEVFGGIGGLRQCLSLNGLQPSVSVICENHAPASRACCCQWPKTIQWGDTATVDEEKIRTLVPHAAKVKLIICGGGFPCSHFSLLKYGRGGHEQDARFREIIRITLLLMKVFPSCQVKRFFECVASMSVEEAVWLTNEINAIALDTTIPEAGDINLVRLIEIDNVDVVPNHRKRYVWLDVELQSEPSESVVTFVTMEHDYVQVVKTKVELLCKWPDSSTWMDNATVMASDRSNAAFFTFTRWIPRKRPPAQPAGIDECDAETIERWKEDQHGFPPYQYQIDNLCIFEDSSGVQSLEPASVQTREKLLMYPPGITREVLAVKFRNNEQRYKTERLGVLGNGFPCGPFAWLLNRALIGWGYSIEAISIQSIVDAYFNAFLPSKDRFDDERRSKNKDLVELLMRYQTHVGGQIKCMPGREFLGSVWPRQSVDASWWEWKTVISFPWDYSDSINVLEARALLNAIRWRAQDTQFVNSRFIHLLDSQVVLGALNKGRSPSINLNRVICRICAHIVAASSKAIYAYVSTDTNPADLPSRRFIVEPWRREQGNVGA